MDEIKEIKDVGKEIEKDIRKEVELSEKVIVKEAKKNANKALWVTGIVLVIIIAFIVTNGFGLFNKNVKTSLEIGNSPVLGDPDAKLIIYEFSDFSCPFCAAADGYGDNEIAILKKSYPDWQPPIPNIIKEYVETGKAKLVFKYYPGHGAGTASHLVGFCLNDQNLFWEFHNLAFQNQQDTISFDKMKALAQQLGANMTQLNNCLDSQKYNSKLTEDADMGTKNSVLGTPSFFIGNTKIEGARSFSYFKEIIDKELQNEQ